MQILKSLANIFKVKHEETFSQGIKLQVVESEETKLFNLDAVTNSKINKHSIYTGGYWDYFIPIAYAYRNPRALMIGLGIGTIPYQLHSLLGKKIKIDIIERDEEVVRLAKKYSPTKIRDNIFVKDGYAYVANTRNKYDILILDAYEKGAQIPKQFFRESFVANASRILRPDGILAINYAMHPSGWFKLFGYKKLLRRFFKVYAIKTRAVGDTAIILCSKRMDKEQIIRKIKISIKMNKNNSVLFESYKAMKEVR